MKIFFKKNDLKRHYRIHTVEKPFVCQTCNRKFAVKSALVRHQATHSDVRSFKCSICPESRYFKTKTNLNQHMKFHFEIKIACSHCKYKTHTKQNLVKHEKSNKKHKLKFQYKYVVVNNLTEFCVEGSHLYAMISASENLFSYTLSFMFKNNNIPFS